MESFKVYIVVRHNLYLKDILELLKEKRKTHKIEFYTLNQDLEDELIEIGFISNDRLHYSIIPDALITCYPDAAYTEQCREVGIKIRILK